MKTIIIWSTNSLQEDYDNIMLVRTKLLKMGHTIQEDWINYRIEIKNNVPRFMQVEGYDYLKTCIDGITNSDLVVFFLSKESNYLTTLIKYTDYHKKKIIIVYRTNKVLKHLDGIERKKNVKLLQSRFISRISSIIK